MHTYSGQKNSSTRGFTLLHYAQRTGIHFEVDMENAFDRVNMSFPLAVSQKFGFPAEFIKIIKACTNGPWITPLGNGRPCNFFQISRGLRQGCPLSPFLYILMVDSLSRNLENCRRSHILTSFSIRKGVKSINH